MPLAYLSFNQTHQVMVFVVAIGYGADFILNRRDISPVQTDITSTPEIRVGLLYIIAMQAAIARF